jgi:acyl-lipid omega-6 desaturase (Delta-12 desaturase)
MAIDTGRLDLRSTLRDPTLTAVAPAASLVRIVVGFAAYGVLAWVAVDTSSWPILALCWFAMSWLLLGNGAGVHEALHRHLFRHRWQNRAAGIVMGATVLFPFHTYRLYHLEHHARAVTADDPEGEPYAMRTRWEYLLVPVGGMGFLAQLWWSTLRGMFGGGPNWTRRGKPRTLAVDLATLLAVAAVVGAVAWVSPWAAVAGWVVPWFVAIGILAPLVLMPEHYAAELNDSNPLTSTSTIRSNPLVGWVYWWNNLHAVHHLWPAVTPQKVRNAQRLLDPHLVDEREETGYVRWHLRRLASR